MAHDQLDYERLYRDYQSRLPPGTGQDEGTYRSERADDEALRRRQEAGLAALFDLAVHVSFATADAPTIISPVRLPQPVPAQPVAKPGLAPPGVLERLRADQLVRNSLYLLLSSGVQAAMGFIFWIVVARRFPTGDVGTASTLVSATSLIAYFALFGLNSTVIRFLPTAPDKNSMVTGILLMVAGCAAVIGLGYALLTPVFAPRVAFISHQPVLILGFVLLNAAAAVNLITDSIFVGSRKANLCVVTDGGVGGLGRITFAILLAGTGAYGIFCASAAGFALAALTSIVLIGVSLHLRPAFHSPLRTLRPLFRFSTANYIANVMNLLPNVVVPILVLDRLGKEAAGYYFVSFQIATLLYAAVQAVEGAFLAEGSQAGTDWRKIRRRSRRLAAILFVPGGTLLVVCAHWILLVFPAGYSQHATSSLQLFAVAVVPIAFCNWSWTVLRLASRLRALIVCNAAFMIGICGSAWVLAPHGLTAVAAAWPIGCAIAAAVATGATAFRPATPARHRRT